MYLQMYLYLCTYSSKATSPRCVRSVVAAIQSSGSLGAILKGSVDGRMPIEWES